MRVPIDTGLSNPGDAISYDHDDAPNSDIIQITAVGAVHLEQRAYYRCAACRASGFPLDERLGLGQAGRLSRYMQEQCAWLRGIGFRDVDCFWKYFELAIFGGFSQGKSGLTA